MRHVSIAFSVAVRVAAVVLLLQLQTMAGSDTREIRRVLVFNDLGSISSPGFALIDQAIFSGLATSPYQIEFYNENLETTLFSDTDSQHAFREWYVRKYRDRKPDLIIAVGRGSIRFMVESHDTAFPNVPIIFCGSTEVMAEELKRHSNFTGVWAVAEPEMTLKAALQLQPGSDTAAECAASEGRPGTDRRTREHRERAGRRRSSHPVRPVRTR
jgi:hypothetical protein